MITCPKCSATLPPAMLKCQFCGTDVSKVERPVEQKAHRGYAAPTWVWTWYTIVCVYWMLGGILDVAFGAGVFSDGRSIVSIILGLIFVVIGLGMLFRIRFLRGVAHFLCWIGLLHGLLVVLVNIIATVAVGPVAYIFAILGLIKAGLSAFMIYLIGETESLYPM